MKFWVMESAYEKQGSAKAFACHDSRNNVYYIPRSQVKVIEKTEPATEYDSVYMLIDVADWIVKKNRLPIFDITELQLER